MLKRSVVVACAGLLVMTAGSVVAGNGGQNGGGWGLPAEEVSCSQVLNDRFEELGASLLDQQTIDDIILIREEEKMARDLYLEMTLLYDISVFPNIARSEQQHMDLVAKLLELHGLPDLAEDKEIGEFTNAWVQETYDALYDLGVQGLIEALWVGAVVEDVDIYHLDHMIEHCADHDFDEVSLIIENMNAGSRNHMRSFWGALEKRGVTYVAVDEEGRISQERLDEIVQSEMETAIVLDEDGEVLAECGLAGGSNR